MTCQCNTIPKTEKKKRGGGLNLVTGSLFLLMPKCAMCWAAYLSLFGWAGFSAIAYRPWFLPVAALLFCFTLARMLRRAIRTRSYFAFGLALTAASLIAWQKLNLLENGLTVAAFLLMGLAWLIDSRPGLLILRSPKRSGA